MVLSNLSRIAINVKNRKIRNVWAEPDTIPAKCKVMQQIGVNIYNLQEFNGFQHIVVRTDYFTKRLDEKPVKDKLKFRLMSKEEICKWTQKFSVIHRRIKWILETNVYYIF